MPTWVIQRFEALAMCDGRDISDGDEPVFVNSFTNDNDFSAVLHENGITGVVQDNYGQDDDNDDGNRNTNDGPDYPP